MPRVPSLSSLWSLRPDLPPRLDREGMMYMLVQSLMVGPPATWKEAVIQKACLHQGWAVASHHVYGPGILLVRTNFGLLVHITPGKDFGQGEFRTPTAHVMYLANDRFGAIWASLPQGCTPVLGAGSLHAKMEERKAWLDAVQGVQGWSGEVASVPSDMVLPGQDSPSCGVLAVRQGATVALLGMRMEHIPAWASVEGPFPPHVVLGVYQAA